MKLLSVMMIFAVLAVSSSANPKEKRHRIARESITADGEFKFSGLIEIISAIFEGMTQPGQLKIKEKLREGSQILYDAATRMFDVYSAGKTELEKKKVVENVFGAFRNLDSVLTPMLNALFLGKTKPEVETIMLHFAKGLRMVLEGGILPMLPDDAFIAKHSAAANVSAEKPKAMLEGAIPPMQPANATLVNNSTSNVNNAEKPK